MPVVTPRLLPLLEALALALAFALAHTQSPLFYSNQNQYLLHGLASPAATATSSHDWLANTRDPTPVFSALDRCRLSQSGFVDDSGRVFPPSDRVLPQHPVAGRGAAGAAGFQDLSVCLRGPLHSCALPRFCASRRWSSQECDYPWYLQCGVANQYFLGPGLQPAVFGDATRGRPGCVREWAHVLAGCWRAGVSRSTSTYLLPTAILTGASRS